MRGAFQKLLELPQKCTNTTEHPVCNEWPSLLPADKKEDNTNSNVGKHDTHPDLHAERIHEGKHSWSLFDGLFDHNGNSERHERFGEVRHLFSLGVDGEGCDCYLSLSSHKLSNHSLENQETSITGNH